MDPEHVVSAVSGRSSVSASRRCGQRRLSVLLVFEMRTKIYSHLVDGNIRDMSRWVQGCCRTAMDGGSWVPGASW